MSSALCLFVDVGSTFTKLVVADATSGALVATAQDRTTIEDDVVRGFDAALGHVPVDVAERIEWAAMSSSAAGGLRIASVGLTEALSGRAGKLAALGAGGKLVLERAGRVTARDLEQIVDADPHIVLLSGGVDGGNTEVIVHNARTIAGLETVPPVIVAGNREVAQLAADALRPRAPDVIVADNVFPEPGRVEIDSTRSAVVELFIRHITRAKGLDRLTTRLGTECEPTPIAVSRGMEVAAGQMGMAVLVDLGGATTDVHSVGGRQHIRSQVELAEPDVIRTVEGDIGMRWGAVGVVDAMGEAWCERIGVELGVDIRDEALRRGRTPGLLAADMQDLLVDAALARAALTIALERHAGRVVVRQNPWGNRYRIQGKDLRRARLLISTGGIFRHLQDRIELVSGALDGAQSRMLPTAPRLLFDDHYAMFAVGLAAARDVDLAGRLLRQVLAIQSTEATRTVEGVLK